MIPYWASVDTLGQFDPERTSSPEYSYEKSKYFWSSGKLGEKISLGQNDPVLCQ